jgi:hypothetical protein
MDDLYFLKETLRIKINKEITLSWKDIVLI